MDCFRSVYFVVPGDALTEVLGEAEVAAGALADVPGDVDGIATDAVGAFETVAVAVVPGLGINDVLGLALGCLFWAQPARITPAAKTITIIKNIIFFKIQSPPSILFFSFFCDSILSNKKTQVQSTRIFQKNEKTVRRLFLFPAGASGTKDCLGKRPCRRA